MKYTLKIALQIFCICLFCISCKKSPTEPERIRIIYTPIPVSPSGAIGHDLFCTVGPIDNYIQDAGIHSMNFDGSDLAYLYRGVQLNSAPRDSVMLFSVYNDSTYLADLRGRTIRRIFSNNGEILYSILSPDAQKILYATRDSVHLYDIPTDLDRTLIPENIYLETPPIFSDDSKHILFSGGNSDNLPYGLYEINSDGSNLTVIDSTTEFASYYDWSPDGNKVCYSSSLSDDLYIRELATGMTDTIHQADISGPIKWSPLGGYIAYPEYPPDGVSGYRVAIVNPQTLQVNHCELPLEVQDLSLSMIEWSADETVLYLALNFIPLYSSNTTIILIVDPIAGTAIRKFTTRTIMNGSLFRLRTKGEH